MSTAWYVYLILETTCTSNLIFQPLELGKIQFPQLKLEPVNPATFPEKAPLDSWSKSIKTEYLHLQFTIFTTR